MDLGVLLESPLGVSPRLEWGHAGALTSQAVSAVSRFPSRGSRDLWLYLEAFPRGFPSRLSHRASHVPPWCDSILGLKVEAVQGKPVSLELTETSRGLWEWWHDLDFLSPLLFREPPLELPRERREFFPDTQGKDPSSRARRGKHGSSECGLGSPASSRVETDMSGNFLSCSKGVKDPFEVPKFRCD